MENIYKIYQGMDFASGFIFIVSVILICGSMLEIFSKHYRENLQQKIINELPENKDFLLSEGGVNAARRARLWTLAFGIGLFLMWFFVLRFFI
jgi:hypothetical protein